MIAAAASHCNLLPTLQRSPVIHAGDCGDWLGGVAERCRTRTTRGDAGARLPSLPRSGSRCGGDGTRGNEAAAGDCGVADDVFLPELALALALGPALDTLLEELLATVSCPEISENKNKRTSMW